MEEVIVTLRLIASCFLRERNVQEAEQIELGPINLLPHLPWYRRRRDNRITKRLNQVWDRLASRLEYRLTFSSSLSQLVHSKSRRPINLRPRLDAKSVGTANGSHLRPDTDEMNGIVGRNSWPRAGRDLADTLSYASQLADRATDISYQEPRLCVRIAS